MIGSVLPAITQAPHVIIAALAVASAVESRHQRTSTVLFHAVTGVILLVAPWIIHSPALIGGQDSVHIFLHRLTAVFHIGHAVFAFRSRHDRVRVEPVVHFAKAISSFFVLLTSVATAYQLYEDKARGLHPSPNFLGCVLLVNGVWFAAEVYQLVSQKATVADEIDQSIKQTQRWIEGRTGRDLQIVFWVDSALAFFGAFVWMSYPGQVLRMIIRREYIIDTIHEATGRAIACHVLFFGIVSLSAIHFSAHHQQSYIIQRIAAMGVMFVEHAYRYIATDITGTGIVFNVVNMAIGIAYASVLVRTSIRLHREGVGADVNGPGQTTTYTVKKSTKAA